MFLYCLACALCKGSCTLYGRSGCRVKQAGKLDADRVCWRQQKSDVVDEHFDSSPGNLRGVKGKSTQPVFSTAAVAAMLLCCGGHAAVLRRSTIEKSRRGRWERGQRGLRGGEGSSKAADAPRSYAC